MALRKAQLQVVILGAGASGLAAAGALTRRGVPLVLLEAREAVGGRVMTVRPRGWPIPLELGAEFIQGKVPALLERARKTKLKVEKAGGAHRVGTGRGRSESGAPLEEALERLARAQRDVPVEQFLAEQAQAGAPPEELAMLRHYVQGYYLADTALASAQAIGGLERASREIQGEEGRRVPEGMGRLLRTLAPELGERLRLNCVARTLRWGPGRVEVSCASRLGTPLPPIRAKRCVVTLPLGVLRERLGLEGTDRFIPELPEKLGAARRLVQGPVTKLLLRFRRPFWERASWSRGLGFLHRAQAPYPTTWTYLPRRVPVLALWAGGQPRSSSGNCARAEGP